MALIPKLTVLERDVANYGYVTVQDTTGVYNAGTNPGGYGAPNPATGDVVKALLRADYLGNASIGVPEEVNVANIQGAGVQWIQTFLEGVTKIVYLLGFTLPGGGVTGLAGNLNFDLIDADTLLAGKEYIELGGELYELNLAAGLTNAGGYVTRAFVDDYLGVAAIMYQSAQVYTLWNDAGYRELVSDIGTTACTSLDCGADAVDALLTRYRFYLATQPMFDNSNYSKAHNLAVALAPDAAVTSPCITC
jgi:hypothetical protein